MLSESSLVLNKKKTSNFSIVLSESLGRRQIWVGNVPSLDDDKLLVQF